MTLSGRVEQLMRQLQAVADQVTRLRAENNALLIANKDLSQQLKQTAADLDIAHTHRLEAEKKEAAWRELSRHPELDGKLREEIEQHIAEIDKCIDWLRNN
jgi:regulator of replication initiation timing